MTNRRMIRLLGRYLDGTASPEDRARIDKWYDALAEGNALSPGSVAQSGAGAAADELKETLYRRIRMVLDGSGQAVVVPLYRRPFLRMAAAACLIAFVAGVGYWFVQRPSPKKETIAQGAVIPDITAPDRSRATLTLSDGTKIALDSAASGTLARQGRTAVQKLANGQLLYKPANNPAGTQNSETAWNTISVPRGSRVIDLTLADGTRVWLNSASSLRYPAGFSGSERTVQITGEAYFEVARDPAHPFNVQKGGVAVRVLGTHFNVNAFDDEAALKITLLEGAVSVREGEQKERLHPGDQALVLGERVRVVKDVDLEEVMAWKNGRFQFGDAADIPSVMRQIARWYDVDPQYEGQPSGHIGGTIARTVNVSAVLRMLELTGAVRFRIEGKKVIVLPAGKK